MGIRKEIREGKDMKESEQIYANLNMKKTGENILSRRERLGMNRPDIKKKMWLAGGSECLELGERKKDAEH